MWHGPRVGARPDAPLPARRAVLRLLAAFAAARSGNGASAAGPPILGAGASFPAPLYQRWANQYRLETAVELQYESVGSVEGLRRLKQGLVDFAGSEVALSSEELQAQDLVQFPAIIGAVVPVFNLRGVERDAMCLSPALLSAIYRGRLQRWNDAALAALNPTLSLPSERITVVHRSDASGTSQLFTTFLAARDAAWAQEIGASPLPAWPQGEGGAGNEGVASLVQRTRAAIGYTEYAYARPHGLKMAGLAVAGGACVAPTPSTFRSAVESARWAAGPRRVTVAFSAAAGWPLTAASHIVMPARSTQPARTRALLQFFDWAFHEGADLAVAQDYVPLPAVALELVVDCWRHHVRDASGAPLWSRGPAR